jgi:hypothetical protein
MSANGISMGGLSRADWLRWGVSFGGALAIMGLLIWSVRGPVVGLPSLSVPTARAEVDVVTPTEQAMMHDTIPLFLPTEHDATVSLPQREGGGNILNYDPSRPLFGDAGPNLSRTLPPAVTLNGKAAEQATPVDTLAPDSAGQPLVGFGRKEAKMAPLPSRGGYIEVISATGQRVIMETLPVASAPETNKEWQPMEFAAFIDASGLAVPLRVTEGSRVEDVDTYFAKFLVEDFRIGARLRPGFYRVIIGP